MCGTSECERLGRAALLVIDMQQGLFDRPVPVYRAEQLVQIVEELVGRAHGAGVPVVYVRHSNTNQLRPGTTAWQLHARLRPTDDDLLIEKTHGDAFEGTELDARLQAMSVHTVFVTGLVTHGCVKATCLGAHERGYAVVLVADGHSSYHRDAEALISEWNDRLRSVLSEVRPSHDIDFSNQVAR